jgi:hydroxymethylglutaryl-CoA reductase (NADPH)
MVPTVIPSFLLKKLYVKGSFKNTPTGFELALRNTLAPGTLIGISPLQIDGRDVPLARIMITAGDAPPVRASDISLTSPRQFPLNVVIKFQVEDQPLAPGSHRVTVQVNTKEAGELKIDAEDKIE